MSKSNWLKKLIFVDEGSEKREEPVKQPEKTSNVRKQASSTPPPLPGSHVSNMSATTVLSEIAITQPLDPSQIIGKADQQLQDKLCNDVLGKQMADGIDYVKFKKSVDSLKNIQPDEALRFNTAYLTLKATFPSLTVESLSQTINQYVDLMEQERKKGLDELNNLRKQNIEKKEVDINKAIGNIEKMKAEIQKLTTFVTEANAEIVEKKNDYALREANFNATVDKIVNQLKGDKVKIETIIKTN
ncbi:hypothetical protein D0T84_08375 [Dysgonomonas sp. 521]|uniref:coiled-coil domain-containing protein 22 n=1 Tax=Dysgonomonas sp. 521 TaxID=2302932 RepID=UPI0013D42F18|nr:coiled-coil domain-containing protein 22 [Dysgonomonas sp. 521]NDV94931.1 hypothetical protein [Dysgonomonas sp. 521]